MNNCDYSLYNEIPSNSYIIDELKLNFNVTDDMIKKSIENVIDPCCKDSDNNYTGSKRLLVYRINGQTDLSRIKQYIIDNYNV